VQTRAVAILGVLAALGLLAAGAAPARTSWDLTGTWQAPSGNTLVLQQSGTTVTWFGQAADKKAWAHDFTGQIIGNTISGTFQDRSGYSVHNRGSISMRIIDDCHMIVTELRIEGGAVTSGGESFTKSPCTSTSAPVVVRIETVSNGCGGSEWRLVVKLLNYLGNTSTYHNSNDTYNIAIRGFTVDFMAACNLHDAGYAGAVVRDRIRGGIKDFRRWTRLQVDRKFLADMRLLCEQQIPKSKKVALANCRGSGGNFSVGAESRYNVVRCLGDRLFDADPSRAGTQRTGPRVNDRLPRTSRECRFKSVE
jgi:hypothetical protein